MGESKQEHDAFSSAGRDDWEIAIIGMAGAFPGAADLDDFWDNVRNGTLSISADAGPPVKAGGVLDGADLFDAAFFGYSPREAELLDPQQRLFLECAWTAIEDAGYGGTQNCPIGVYAGSSLSTYLLEQIRRVRTVDETDLILGNSQDMLATRVAYHLNLAGPAVSVQTACSTSLVAVHLACQALLSGDCDIALAGGVSVRFPQQGLHLPGDGILSPDGRCLPFDSNASGTVCGNGVGVVVLKPLIAAISDGDHIRAVIKATSINNDGRRKVGFTAPSAQGQAAVINSAHALAGTHPATIDYVEAHGTATALGDPIEFAALAEAFARRDPQQHGRCTLGSVKSLIGHLDAAAGIAGVIKTALAVEHNVLPPSPYFHAANPAIDLDGSPFQVLTKAQPWHSDGPRRAAISSFGIGGTNAHLVMEQAPPRRPSNTSPRPHQLIVLSAKTSTALDKAANSMRTHVAETKPGMADIAYTLQSGRAALPHRMAVVCDSDAQVLPESVMTGHVRAGRRDVVFMFSGQGAQHPGMGAELYQHERVYRDAFDECAELLLPELGVDLRDVVLKADAPGMVRQTQYGQPALFAVEYALSRLWAQWGVQPTAMIGHSVGEYVAACLAGTLDLPDAVALVAARGRLMQAMPPGRMLSIPLPAGEIEQWLTEDLVIAATNGPSLTVVSGRTEDADKLEQELTAQGVAVRALHTSHAFHSPAMDPVLDEYRATVGRVTLAAPQIPFVSNLTGSWITDQQATSPDYWVQHLRQPVRFHEGLRTLAEIGPLALLELGPGTTLATFARQSLAADEPVVATSLPRPGSRTDAVRTITEALGTLWLAGIEPDWAGYWSDESRNLVQLPTYPFERRRYWLGASGEETVAVEVESPRPEHPRPMITAAYVAPRDETEERVAAVWREFLGIAEVGVHDNFFELGGHSLLATRIVARLLDEFGVEITPGVLLDMPTIAELSAHVSTLPQEDDALLAELLSATGSSKDEWIAALLDDQPAAGHESQGPR